MSYKRFLIVLSILIAIPLLSHAAATYNEIKAYQLGLASKPTPALAARGETGHFHAAMQMI
jgi:hypothetical protein